MDQLLTGGEVADILRISRSYAYMLMKRGEIPTVRIGSVVRVRLEDLDAYIRAMPNEDDEQGSNSCCGRRTGLDNALSSNQ